LTKFEKAEEL